MWKAAVVENWYDPLLLLVSTILTANVAYADPVCRHGDRDIGLTILPPSGLVLSLRVDSAYFDQRIIPRDGSSREGLLLRMQATDFSPWPYGLRPHPSEGPMLLYLLTSLVPFDELADVVVRLETGYRFGEAMDLSYRPGPFDLSVPVVAPPDPVRQGGNIGTRDIYIARDGSEHVTDVIRCRRPGDTPFQTCQHSIEAGNMDIQITYAPDFLPEWKRLSDGAKRFLSCMSSS